MLPLTGAWRVEKHLRFLADLRGNSVLDIVSFGDRGVWVALGDGGGRFNSAGSDPVLKRFGYDEEAGGWRVNRHPRFLADLRGRGILDIVGFHDRGTWVARGNGDGSFHSAQLGPVGSFGCDALTKALHIVK